MPGAPLSVVVSHCPAGSLVRITVDGSQIGQATTDATGAYQGELPLPPLAVGLHTAKARCADVVATTPLNLVVATATSASGGAAAATGAFALAFFVLVGTFLLRQDSPIGVRQRWTSDVDETADPDTTG